MDLESVVDCPPLVQLGGESRQPAFLLAWLRLEVTGEWRAIVTYVRQVGDRPPERKLVEVSAGRCRPLGPPAAYRSVRRLQLGRDGTVADWQPPAPADP